MFGRIHQVFVNRWILLQYIPQKISHQSIMRLRKDESFDLDTDSFPGSTFV